MDSFRFHNEESLHRGRELNMVEQGAIAESGEETPGSVPAGGMALRWEASQRPEVHKEGTGRVGRNSLKDRKGADLGGFRCLGMVSGAYSVLTDYKYLKSLSVLISLWRPAHGLVEILSDVRQN